MTHGLEEGGRASSEEAHADLVCPECIGNEDSKEVSPGEAMPEPQGRLGAFTDIPNICAFARQIKGNLLLCLEA